jgi:hypothetical protein
MEIFQLLFLLIYAVPFYFVFMPPLIYILFVVGLALGWLVMFLDKKILFKYYLEDDEQTAFIQLITRSLLFVGVLIPLSLYVLTSTGSALAIGMMLGIWLVLIFEMWNSKKKIKVFNKQFLSNFKTSLDQSAINWLVLALTGFFIFISASLFL